MDSNDGALAKQQISHQIQIQNNSFIKQRHFEINLKSCEIINESYFCIRQKNRRKHKQHFKTAVFSHKIYTLSHQPKYLHIEN